ncbi:MAG: aminopeptidase N [Nocardioides sp.]
MSAGINITQVEAAGRAAILDATGYQVALDLSEATTAGVTTFASTTTIAFTCSEPGSSTWADLIAARIDTISLNGASLDPAEVYDGFRVQLSDLAAENVLVIAADMAYSHSGEGIHHFVDPSDAKVYLYSQFEVPDACRVFATFEQPDLKSTYQFTVTAPAHWKVVSNMASPTPVPAGQGTAVWAFEPTHTMSTYLAAIVAGDYVEWTDVYHGTFGDIPLGVFCRASIAAAMDADNVFALTKQGFEYFEGAFGIAYPFGKYDQLFVPEYNMGAMENAGCVTIKDEYVPQGRAPRSLYEFRASIILHEMAHMWFGDLVTMKWWNDLWLNESFAEWACYQAEVEATEFTDAWTGFTNARKQTGYRADQLSTTHPIAPPINDLAEIEVSFDMITYAKGASVLKQLVAWVGKEPFLAGLSSYFKEFAWSNATFADLLGHLEAASGRELTSWAAEWLQTSEVNTFTPEFTLDANGSYASLAVRQTAPAAHPTLRRHRTGVGFYDLGDDGSLTRSSYLEIDVEGALTEIPQAVGMKQPDLLLLNDEDLTYAKIRLDDRSLATALTSLSQIPDSLARALVWGAAWDMTRDGEMPAAEFVDLVLANIGSETDSWGLTRTPHYAELAINAYAHPSKRRALQERWEAGLRELILTAEPGSDAQLSFVHRYTGAGELLRGQVPGAPVGDQTIADLRGLLSGDWAPQGLAVDQPMRWYVLIGLAAAGAVGEDEIAAEAARDGSNTGQEKAWEARAALPTAEAKAAAFAKGWQDPTTPNETARSIYTSFARIGQEELLMPFLPKLLTAADTLWSHIGAQKASVALEYGFPRMLNSPEAVAMIEDWLATTSAGVGAKKYVRDALDEIRRGIIAQEADASVI